jgi:hypothetical protein
VSNKSTLYFSNTNSTNTIVFNGTSSTSTGDLIISTPERFFGVAIGVEKNTYLPFETFFVGQFANKQLAKQFKVMVESILTLSNKFRIKHLGHSYYLFYFKKLPSEAKINSVLDKKFNITLHELG